MTYSWVPAAKICGLASSICRERGRRKASKRPIAGIWGSLGEKFGHLGEELRAGDGRFSRLRGSQSFGFRGGENGAWTRRRVLLHQHDNAFAVAGGARHFEGRGPANPIAELIDRADDIRIGDAAPGVFPALDKNRAGAGNPECKNTRRAAALGDLGD